MNWSTELYILMASDWSPDTLLASDWLALTRAWPLSVCNVYSRRADVLSALPGQLSTGHTGAASDPRVVIQRQASGRENIQHQAHWTPSVTNNGQQWGSHNTGTTPVSPNSEKQLLYTVRKRGFFEKAIKRNIVHKQFVRIFWDYFCKDRILLGPALAWWREEREREGQVVSGDWRPGLGWTMQ